MYSAVQERMIVRGGGRASNFARFGDGRNNPPVDTIFRNTRETHGAILFHCAAEVAIFSTVQIFRPFYGRQLELDALPPPRTIMRSCAVS